MPATICGSAAGRTMRADALVPRECRTTAPCRSSVGSIAADAVDRVQQHREEAEEGDEARSSACSPIEWSRTIEIGSSAGGGIARQYSMCGIAARRAQRREPERDAERDAGDDGDREAGADPLEARDDVPCRTGRRATGAGTRRGSSTSRGNFAVVCARRPELPGEQDRERHRDLGADLRARGTRARSSAAAPAATGASAARAARSHVNARWIARPRKPVASASA